MPASREHKDIAHFYITNTAETFRYPAKSCSYDTNTLKQLRSNVVCCGQAACSVVGTTRVKILRIFSDGGYWS